MSRLLLRKIVDSSSANQSLRRLTCVPHTQFEGSRTIRRDSRVSPTSSPRSTESRILSPQGPRVGMLLETPRELNFGATARRRVGARWETTHVGHLGEARARPKRRETTHVCREVSVSLPKAYFSNDRTSYSSGSGSESGSASTGLPSFRRPREQSSEVRARIAP